MQLILLVVIVTISSVIFAVLFKALNKSILGLFKGVQAYTNKLKKKTLWKILSGVVLLLIGIAIVRMLNLGIYGFGIILSFVTSLNEILFENPSEESQQTTFKNKTK